MLARGLLEYETLTGDEIIALLKGIPPVRTPYEEPELPTRGEGTVGAGRRQAAPPRPGPDHLARAAAGTLNRQHLIWKRAASAALFF